ncbi:MAG: nucleotidyltransferase family protein [Firmicutes bacterium]|nr:nucleotidyltransferase family protein [Bacillota bacterium]
MTTVGITAEYNPLHNGHVYHAAQARKLSGADCVIAVMSGNFTQRGEPAVCDKWERAKAAVVSAEVDLVAELPFAFACSRASVFAAGAVDSLIGLGADCISFGCEAEDPSQLQKLAEMLVSDAAEIEESRSGYMKKGISSAKAYEMAVTEAAGEQAAMLLLAPNNILAIEYLKRILYWCGKGRTVMSLPVRRFGSGYKEAAGENAGFAGAGALRKMIEAGEDVSGYIPCAQQFEDTVQLQSRYLQQLKGIALRSDADQLSRIYGVGEGMENAIIRELRKAESLGQLISALTSKRYTQATVRRALTHLLVGTSWDEVDRLTAEGPSAVRLLAARDAGRRLMRERNDETLRIVTNRNKEDEQLSLASRELLDLDERAADLYNLLRARDIRTSSDRVMRPYIG